MAAPSGASIQRVLIWPWYAGDPAAIVDAAPPALPERPPWHHAAACRGRADFVGARRPPPDAEGVCATCPVRRECACSALDAIASGTWLMGTWAGVHLGVTGGRKVARAALREVAGSAS